MKKIFVEGELIENSVCRDFRHTAEDSKQYTTKYYNLRAITAVGYRVNSHRAIEFRKWATEILHEYIIKGFAMDDERLKQIRHYLLANLIISANTPDAVTSGPAPAPLITKGCSLYRRVYSKIILSIPSN